MESSERSAGIMGRVLETGIASEYASCGTAGGISAHDSGSGISDSLAVSYTRVIADEVDVISHQILSKDADFVASCTWHEKSACQQGHSFTEDLQTQPLGSLPEVSANVLSSRHSSTPPERCVRDEDYKSAKSSNLENDGNSFFKQRMVQSFIDVLSRDDLTVLKWPSEMIAYTLSRPSVSYGCNPLNFDFSVPSSTRDGESMASRAKTRESDAVIENTVKRVVHELVVAVHKEQSITSNDACSASSGHALVAASLGAMFGGRQSGGSKRRQYRWRRSGDAGQLAAGEEAVDSEERKKKKHKKTRRKHKKPMTADTLPLATDCGHGKSIQGCSEAVDLLSSENKGSHLSANAVIDDAAAAVTAGGLSNGSPKLAELDSTAASLKKRRKHRKRKRKNKKGKKEKKERGNETRAVVPGGVAVVAEMLAPVAAESIMTSDAAAAQQPKVERNDKRVKSRTIEKAPTTNVPAKSSSAEDGQSLLSASLATGTENEKAVGELSPKDVPNISSSPALSAYSALNDSKKTTAASLVVASIVCKRSMPGAVGQNSPKKIKIAFKANAMAATKVVSGQREGPSSSKWDTSSDSEAEHKKGAISCRFYDDSDNENTRQLSKHEAVEVVVAPNADAKAALPAAVPSQLVVIAGGMGTARLTADGHSTVEGVPVACISQVTTTAPVQLPPSLAAVEKLSSRSRSRSRSRSLTRSRSHSARSYSSTSYRSSRSRSYSSDKHVRRRGRKRRKGHCTGSRSRSSSGSRRSGTRGRSRRRSRSSSYRSTHSGSSRSSCGYRRRRRRRRSYTRSSRSYSSASSISYYHSSRSRSSRNRRRRRSSSSRRDSSSRSRSASAAMRRSRRRELRSSPDVQYSSVLPKRLPPRGPQGRQGSGSKKPMQPRKPAALSLTQPVALRPGHVAPIVQELLSKVKAKQDATGEVTVAHAGGTGDAHKVAQVPIIGRIPGVKSRLPQAGDSVGANNEKPASVECVQTSSSQRNTAAEGSGIKEPSETGSQGLLDVLESAVGNKTYTDVSSVMPEPLATEHQKPGQPFIGPVRPGEREDSSEIPLPTELPRKEKSPPPVSQLPQPWSIMSQLPGEVSEGYRELQEQAAIHAARQRRLHQLHTNNSVRLLPTYRPSVQQSSLMQVEQRQAFSYEARSAMTDAEAAAEQFLPSDMQLETAGDDDEQPQQPAPHEAVIQSYAQQILMSKHKAMYPQPRTPPPPMFASAAAVHHHHQAAAAAAAGLPVPAGTPLQAGSPVMLAMPSPAAAAAAHMQLAQQQFVHAQAVAQMQAAAAAASALPYHFATHPGLVHGASGGGLHGLHLGGGLPGLHFGSGSGAGGGLTLAHPGLQHLFAPHPAQQLLPAMPQLLPMPLGAAMAGGPQMMNGGIMMINGTPHLLLQRLHRPL